MDIVHQTDLKLHDQIDGQLLPTQISIWTILGASETQFMFWILLCSSSHLNKEWLTESVILCSPDDPTNLLTIWGSPRQRWYRDHVLLQNGHPIVPSHSKDTLAVIMSLVGVDELHRTTGLESTITPPRKPNNRTRPTIRVGLREKDKTQTWISHNHLLDLDKTLVTDVARIFQSPPT